MLFPFHGYLLGGSDPATSAVAAAGARRLREGARRYQPGELVARAVADGLLRPTAAPRLFRYRIDDETSGRSVVGLVGEVAVGDLLPHEGTRGGPIDPAPPIEIRPILLVTRAPLPRTRAFGPSASVVEGRRRHAVVAVQGGTPAFEGAPLVIADGHHRTRAVHRSRGAEARTLAMVIGDGGRGLTVGTFHRRFVGVGALPHRVAELFEVRPTQRRGPMPGALLWVQGSGERYLLSPRPEALAAVPEGLRESAAAVAAAALYPALGIAEDVADYVATARSAVRGLGADDAAILMPAVPMESVLTAAESGTPFPPKGTRFAPKPVRGVILRVDPAG